MRTPRSTPDSKPAIPKRRRARLYVRRLGHYVVRGVLVLAPIAITLAALGWLFRSIDNLLQPYVQIPGAGFVSVFLLILFVGWVSEFWVIERIIDILDEWLARVPGVRLVYAPVRDFLNALVGRERRFNRTVLVRLFDTDVWAIGFLTGEDIAAFELGADFVAIYVPQAYNVAGQLYLVPRDRVRPLEKLSAGDAMRYAVTGGAVDPSTNGATPVPLP
ncbi:MAG: DUF502 domain-containing protein [Opitutae bacterium]|nr:DUF502 domain-containing protein [Opitutae bacterium]